LGRVTDRLVDLGGSAVLGEIAEIMGAEHLLAARATREETATQLIQIITRVESEARALGLDIRGTQPSPGNIRGGLTTIEEKSLGATHKGGERAHLEDVVGYAAPIRRKGLTVMDTPGLDVESVTGMVGGGAQVVVFTTGLGTPTGNPIAPVIKITGNARTARQMADNLDLEVSGIMSDTESLDAAAERLFDEVLAVASGKETAAERLGHREFAIHRRNPTI
jgi:altronate dehydratase large subunit